MKNIKLLIVATIITVVLTPFGLLWNLGKSLFESFQLRFWRGPINVLKYWLNIIYQILVALSYLVRNILKYNFWYNLAYMQDLFWNAAAGELLEDILAVEEKTAFGIGKITVSAAIGRQEKRNDLTKLGWWFSGILNRFFNEKAHCLDSWERLKDRYNKGIKLKVVFQMKHE